MGAHPKSPWQEDGIKAMKEKSIAVEVEQAFHRIVEASEKLYPLFLDDERHEFSNAVDLLKHKVIPLLRHECPLLVAVTGGHNAGKSTLFNFLAGGRHSGVSSLGGYTRRTLAAIHPSVACNRARHSSRLRALKVDDACV